MTPFAKASEGHASVALAKEEVSLDKARIKIYE